MNRATKNDSWVRNPDGTLGFTCSIVTGCTMNHPYCFARKLANGRLRERYLANHKVACEPIKSPWPAAINDPFYPRFWPERLVNLDYFLAGCETPVGIFLNIMGDGFGDLVPENWIEPQLEVIQRHLRHRIYLLTSHPHNLAPWSPFPNNCWVGVTATNFDTMDKALEFLPYIEAKVKFLSIEPFLDEIPIPYSGFDVDWLIIGAMTGTKKDIAMLHIKYPQLVPMPWGKRWTLQPDIEWVEEVVKAADEAGIPVFLKDNLAPLFGNMRPEAGIAWALTKECGYYCDESVGHVDHYLRQEMPSQKGGRNEVPQV